VKIVGTDRVTASGDAANKIGTYLKALAEKDNNISLHVVLPSSTIDWNMPKGADIPIEEHSIGEMLKMTGRTPTGTVLTVDIAAPAQPPLPRLRRDARARLIHSPFIFRAWPKL
jgi:methylthioribose-1-phosphate isomerase